VHAIPNPRWPQRNNIDYDNTVLPLSNKEQPKKERLCVLSVNQRPPSIPDNLAPEIIAWIKKGPRGCGLDRANWTYSELTTYLYQQKGLTVGETTLRAFCVKHGVRPYRPTYVYLKGDPDKQAQARQDLEAFQKKPKLASLCC